MKEMKQLYKVFALLILTSIGLSACEEDANLLFDDENAFFAFNNEKANLVEGAEQTLDIEVYLARTEPTGQVSYAIDVEGLEFPAVEGLDFEIVSESKQLNFAESLSEFISIKALDNDEKDGVRQFRIKLLNEGASFNVGMSDNVGTSFLVSLNDDDITINDLPGMFTLYETTLEPKAYDYEVSVHPNDDENALTLRNLWLLEQDLTIRFDPEGDEVIIPQGQIFTDVNVNIHQGVTGLVDVQVMRLGMVDGSYAYFPDDDIRGNYSLAEGRIVFPEGYLLMVVAPADHPYYGLGLTHLAQTYMEMNRTGDLPADLQIEATSLQGRIGPESAIAMPNGIADFNKL